MPLIIKITIAIIIMIIITTTTTIIDKIANREMNILLRQGVLSTGDSPRLMTAKMINHKIEEVTMKILTINMILVMVIRKITKNWRLRWWAKLQQSGY